MAFLFAVGVTVTHWAEARGGRCSPASINGRAPLICGQAPSDYPEFAQFLVAQGIDSISRNPDSVLKTMVAIVEAEKGTPSVGSRAMAETSR